MNKLWVIEGRVSDDADIIQLYSEIMGRPVKAGDIEYRVVDDVENPGWSADYPSLEMALREHPTASYLSPREERLGSGR